MNKQQLKKLIEIINGVEYGKIIINKEGGKIHLVKQEKSFKI